MKVGQPKVRLSIDTFLEAIRGYTLLIFDFFQVIVFYLV